MKSVMKFLSGGIETEVVISKEELRKVIAVLVKERNGCKASFDAYDIGREAGISFAIGTLKELI